MQLGSTLLLPYSGVDNTYGRSGQSKDKQQSSYLMLVDHFHFGGLPDTESPPLRPFRSYMVSSTNPEVAQFEAYNSTDDAKLGVLTGEGVAGVLRSVFGTLSQFTISDLSENNFNGSFPDSLGRIRTLREQNLGHNKLSGELPSFSADSLDNLEMLRTPLTVRPRRNGTLAARAPSAEQDKTTETTRRIDFGQRFRRCGERKIVNRPEAKFFATTPSAIRLQRCARRAKLTDAADFKFNSHVCEPAQRRSVKPSVRRRPLRVQAGAAIKWADTHAQVSNGEILFAEGGRLILAIAISISLERRLHSRKSAERNQRELRLAGNCRIACSS
ncbi:hypothetical protein AXG93_4751s1180 [Marchantia polymorpha subsp. ruderalis]|uniref:Uncharacterized protein n=1 Tax=Marchantia polymorpha subsp. ruderalis TaxID=1480154 RepID=A0A176VFJ2_MARPO|nr:hypothetical protein AXG93_4751s1180 [Marchantia polymorpha subsp. ruderalis]